MELRTKGGNVKRMVWTAIEVYPKETNGMLVGKYNDNGILLTNTLPFQRDDRKNTSVNHETLDFKDFFGSVYALGDTIIGGYHSHPRGAMGLTPEDKHYTKEEIEYLEMFGYKLDRWLEMVIRIEKVKHRKAHDIGCRQAKKGGFIEWDLQHGPYRSFEIEIGCYLLEKGWAGIKTNKIPIDTI